MTTLSQTALDLAKQYAGDDKRAYAKAKLVADGVESGLTVRQIADATSEARVKLAHPTADADTVARLVNEKLYSVSSSQVGQYRIAWELVTLAGLTPTADTVNAAFKPVARSATPEIAAFRSGLKSGAVVITDAESFVSSMLDIMLAVAARKSSAREEKVLPAEPETSSPAGQPDPLEVTPANAVPESFEVIVTSIRALTERAGDFTPAQAKALLAELDELYTGLIATADRKVLTLRKTPAAV